MTLRTLDGFLLGRFGRPHGATARRAALVSAATRGGVGWHLVSAGLVLTGRRTPRWIAAAATVAWATTSLAVAGLKRIIRRRRPHAAASGPTTRSSSMPSSHTATAFAFSSAAAIQHPAATPLLLVAVATAWSRLRTRRHFPTDVAVGAAIGLTLGAAVGVWARRLRRRGGGRVMSDAGPVDGEDGPDMGS